MHKRALMGGVLGLLLVVSTLAAFTGVASAQKNKVETTAGPTSDVIGIGLFSCKTVTGEIGFSPTTISSGSIGTPETVSIWFDATKCVPNTGVVVKPLPKTVIGSESFISNQGNLCPQLSTPPGTPLGTGTLNLAYNFPPVPTPTIIDPTVGQSVTVTQVGGYWNLAGALGAGSYPSGNFTAHLHPVLVGAESCNTAVGVTSMWINHGTLSNV